MLLNVLIFFIIGTLFGSLGSVLLIRLSENVNKETIKGILRGRSKCPKCGATLKARNLIPIISFFRQGGKCEQCKQKIPYLYPALELLSGLVFVASFLIFGNLGIMLVIFRCIVNRLLLLLIVYDVLRYELHVPLRIILILVAALPQFFGGLGNYGWALGSVALFSIFFVGIFFLAKWYIRKKYHQSVEGFGEGDIYLAGAIGFLVPFIIQYNQLQFDAPTLINLLLLFVISSSVLGILFRIIIKIIKHFSPQAFINTISPLFQDKILIPFIPAMIVAFRILLWKASFFIGVFF
ncbi:MAG: prepilin peptidase [Candidatus Absconditabacterales bacterium]